MEGDIVQMGAYIGAGLACTGMGGAAVGVGHVVGNFLSGALRNPSAAAGQTATVTRTFTDSFRGSSRSVSLTFGLSSISIPATNYSSANANYTGFGWHNITSVAINSSSGFWRNSDNYIAKVTLSSNNPYRNNHPTEGTLTEAGAYFVATSTNSTNKRLRLRGAGLLQIEDSDGSNVIWTSGNSSTTDEPKIVAGTTTSVNVSGTCGKRVSDCRLRFPSGDAHGGLPFGSFPALGLNN